jgi:hypothetical protein
MTRLRIPHQAQNDEMEADSEGGISICTKHTLNLGFWVVVASSVLRAASIVCTA